MTVSFNVAAQDAEVIRLIVDRAEAAGLVKSKDRMSTTMDLTATHANGCPLDLRRLLHDADDFNLAHDIFGIARHLDRDTGQLGGHFLPRFHQRA